jgi:hypothetical protein
MESSNIISKLKVIPKATCSENSQLVSEVLSRLAQDSNVANGDEVSLQEIAFGPRSSSGFQYSYTLVSNMHSTETRYKNIGEALQDRTSQKSDPIQAYLAVWVQDPQPRILEAYCPRTAPNEFWLADQGCSIGKIQEIVSDLPWWKTIFCGTRQWEIYLREKLVATIEAKYPVSSSSILNFNQLFGSTVQISLASRFVGNTNLTRLVIPADARFTSPEVVPLFFLVKLLFRTYYFTLDFSES